MFWNKKDLEKKEDNNLVCEECGHLFKRGTGQTIKSNYGDKNYCGEHKKPYDRMVLDYEYTETGIYHRVTYYKEFKVDEKGKIKK